MPTFFNPETRAFRTSGSYKLYPTHCKRPTTSHIDQTLQNANELYKALKLTPAQEHQLSTQRKLQHIKALQDLTNIITNSTPPRAKPNETPPLGPVTLPRLNVPSTSVNPTSQNTIFKNKLVHQRKTRANTPMSTIIKEVEPPVNNTPVTNNQPKQKSPITTSQPR